MLRRWCSPSKFLCAFYGGNCHLIHFYFGGMIATCGDTSKNELAEDGMKGNLQLIVGASAVVSARNCARIRCSPTTSCPLCWYYMTVFRDLSPNTHFCVTISGMSTGRWWKGVNVVVDGAITCQHMGWVGSWDMGQPGVRLTVGSKKTRCSTSGPTICDLRDPTPIPTRGRFSKSDHLHINATHQVVLGDPNIHRKWIHRIPRCGTRTSSLALCAASWCQPSFTV
jgi:hypothetical protein